MEHVEVPASGPIGDSGRVMTQAYSCSPQALLLVACQLLDEAVELGPLDLVEGSCVSGLLGCRSRADITLVHHGATRVEQLCVRCKIAIYFTAATVEHSQLTKTQIKQHGLASMLTQLLRRGQELTHVAVGPAFARRFEMLLRKWH